LDQGPKLKLVSRTADALAESRQGDIAKDRIDLLSQTLPNDLCPKRLQLFVSKVGTFEWIPGDSGIEEAGIKSVHVPRVAVPGVD